VNKPNLVIKKSYLMFSGWNCSTWLTALSLHDEKDLVEDNLLLLSYSGRVQHAIMEMMQTYNQILHTMSEEKKEELFGRIIAANEENLWVIGLVHDQADYYVLGKILLDQCNDGPGYYK